MWIQPNGLESEISIKNNGKTMNFTWNSSLHSKLSRSQFQPSHFPKFPKFRNLGIKPIQAGLFSTFWDRGGGGSEAPYVTLKPLTLWPPSLHRIVYALILTSTDTVISLWRDVTSLRHYLLLNVLLRSSKAIKLLNTVPEGVKILFWGIKGINNTFSECIFLEDMKFCR